MHIELTLLKEIHRQIAHIMASYGDNPEELMWKLECLVMQWFEKGLNYNERTQHDN